jgi:hypothetical protein
MPWSEVPKLYWGTYVEKLAETKTNNQLASSLVIARNSWSGGHEIESPKITISLAKARRALRSNPYWLAQFDIVKTLLLQPSRFLNKMYYPLVQIRIRHFKMVISLDNPFNMSCIASLMCPPRYYLNSPLHNCTVQQLDPMFMLSL